MTPLGGRRILVTRAPHQASALADSLRDLGATTVLIPTIEIGPAVSYTTLDAALARLGSFDLVAFTSANAVVAFGQRAQRLRLLPAPRRIAAVGPATARALESLNLRADLLPPLYTAESLAQTILKGLPEPRASRILLVLAEEAPATLRSALEAAGAHVTVAPAYANRIPAASLTAIAALFADGAAWPDAITFTSASTARNLVALLEAANLTLPSSILRASIGPVTSRALRELGLPPDVEAAEATIASLVDILVARLGSGVASRVGSEGIDGASGKLGAANLAAPDGTVGDMNPALLKTDLATDPASPPGGLTLLARGKVRDLYALGPGPDSDLLFVATDRISAFDHVLATGIPDKGRILTQISAFWFDFLGDTVANHLLPRTSPEIEAQLAPFREQLAGRSMVVRRARMYPVECVVRGYLSGSGWKDYLRTGAVCGIALPEGLRESEKLPEPIFTPAAKVDTGGHDENISYAEMEQTVGVEMAAELRRLTLTIYAKAAAYAAGKGLILADTKFEFGWIADRTAVGIANLAGTGRIVLADEVLTPDSSRYWPADAYAPGGPQPSFDKQYVRDYLESIAWNKQAPAPGLPDQVVLRTREKYLEAFHLLTGREALD